MNTLPLFDQEFNQGFREEDPLSVFRKEPEQVTDIREGMTAKEIAEFVSDRLIAIIKEQFDAAGKQFEEKGK